jgi:hypothetical protein
MILWSRLPKRCPVSLSIRAIWSKSSRLPVNVQSISDLVEDHPVYFWKDVTEYRNNYTEGILHPPMAGAKPEVVGNLNFTHADDWLDQRTILLYKDGETMQTVGFFRSRGSWLTIISAQLGLAKTQD